MKAQLLFLCLFLSLSVFADLPEYHCKKVKDENILVDGKGSDSLWLQAPELNLVNISDGSRALEKTVAQLLWSDKGLYLLMQASNVDVWGEMEKRDDPVWKEDALELFLDPDGDGRNYYEFEWNQKNTLLDFIMRAPWGVEGAGNVGSYTAKGLQSAVQVHGSPNDSSDRDRGLTLEVMIPWGALDSNLVQMPPKAGTVMRLNLYRAEYANRTDPAEWTAWSPTGAVAAHQPEKFGRVILDPSP